MIRRPNAYFDVNIEGKNVGRIIFELFADYVPKTCQNFMALCTGNHLNKEKKVLHYKGSPFHRIIPNFMVQGGDITSGNGFGGESIFGQKFDDESFDIPHVIPGLLSMANSGPNTNGSQFFITTVPCPWLDGHHVVFGRVIKGYDIVKALEATGTYNGIPTKKSEIGDCGLISN